MDLITLFMGLLLYVWFVLSFFTKMAGRIYLSRFGFHQTSVLKTSSRVLVFPPVVI